jgi:hypothetical protein
MVKNVWGLGEVSTVQGQSGGFNDRPVVSGSAAQGPRTVPGCIKRYEDWPKSLKVLDSPLEVGGTGELPFLAVGPPLGGSREDQDFSSEFYARSNNHL